MTNEEILCCRELLLCGIAEPLTRRLDAALEIEDPLSDLTLTLSFCTSDDEKFKALNDYLWTVPDDRMDAPAACRMILDEFRTIRASGSLTPDEIAYCLYRIAVNAKGLVSANIPLFIADTPLTWDMYRIGCIFDEIPYLASEEEAVRLLDFFLAEGHLPADKK